jgi:hypothetical protein
MIRLIAIILSLGALSLVLFLLFNRDQKQWHDMTEKEQEKKKILMTGGIIVFLAGLLTAYFTGKKK